MALEQWILEKRATAARVAALAWLALTLVFISHGVWTATTVVLNGRVRPEAAHAAVDIPAAEPTVFLAKQDADESSHDEQRILAVGEEQAMLRIAEQNKFRDEENAKPGSESALANLIETHEHDRDDNPLVDMVVGIIGFVMSLSLLWLNEGHAVRMRLMLDLVNQRVKNLGTRAEPDQENLRELVYLQGTAHPVDPRSGELPTSDNELRLELGEWGDLQAPSGAVKLRAVCSMYQWEEEKDDNKTKYKKLWKHHWINSSRFERSSEYTNPAFPVNPTDVKLACVRVGEALTASKTKPSFLLSRKMLGKLQNYMPCSVPQDVLGRIDLSLSEKGYSPGSRVTFSLPSALQTTKDAVPAIYFAKAHSNGSQYNPAIGDLMVIFQYVPSTPVSVLGIQVHNPRQF